MKKQQKHINKLVKLLMSKGIRYYRKFNKNGYEKAIKKFDKVIGLNPNNARAYCCRGDVYFIIEPEKAIQDYTKAIKLNPNYIDAYKYRALTYDLLLYNEQNATILDYNPVISDYTSILKINPNYFEAYLYRGKIYRKLQQYPNAIKDFTMMTKSNDKWEKSNAYIELGDTYCLIKDFKRAILSYTHAIEILRNNYTASSLLIDCYKTRSELYLQLGAKERANNDLKLVDRYLEDFENKEQNDNA